MTNPPTKQKSSTSTWWIGSMLYKTAEVAFTLVTSITKDPTNLREAVILGDTTKFEEEFSETYKTKQDVQFFLCQILSSIDDFAIAKAGGGEESRPQIIGSKFRAPSGFTEHLKESGDKTVLANFHRKIEILELMSTQSCFDLIPFAGLDQLLYLHQSLERLSEQYSKGSDEARLLKACRNRTQNIIKDILKREDLNTDLAFIYSISGSCSIDFAYQFTDPEAAYGMGGRRRLAIGRSLDMGTTIQTALTELLDQGVVTLPSELKVDEAIGILESRFFEEQETALRPITLEQFITSLSTLKTTLEKHDRLTPEIQSSISTSIDGAIEAELEEYETLQKEGRFWKILELKALIKKHDISDSKYKGRIDAVIAETVTVKISRLRKIQRERKSTVDYIAGGEITVQDIFAYTIGEIQMLQEALRESGNLEEYQEELHALINEIIILEINHILGQKISPQEKIELLLNLETRGNLTGQSKEMMEDIIIFLESTLSQIESEYPMTLLGLAIISEEHDFMNKMRGIKGIVNSRDGNGYTPLMLACLSNNSRLVEELLRYPDIDINLCTTDGHNAFHIAMALAKERPYTMKRESEKIREMLLMHGITNVAMPKDPMIQQMLTLAKNIYGKLPYVAYLLDTLSGLAETNAGRFVLSFIPPAAPAIHAAREVFKWIHVFNNIIEGFQSGLRLPHYIMGDRTMSAHKLDLAGKIMIGLGNEQKEYSEEFFTNINEAIWNQDQLDKYVDKNIHSIEQLHSLYVMCITLESRHKQLSAQGESELLDQVEQAWGSISAKAGMLFRDKKVQLEEYEQSLLVKEDNTRREWLASKCKQYKLHFVTAVLYAGWNAATTLCSHEAVKSLAKNPLAAAGTALSTVTFCATALSNPALCAALLMATAGFMAATAIGLEHTGVVNISGKIQQVVNIFSKTIEQEEAMDTPALGVE